MRHRKEGRKLSRTASHRRALLSSLSTALIKHKKIKTTVAKAKETRRIVEPLITRARNAFLQEKEGAPKNVSARREVAKFIHDRIAVQTLFAEIAEKVGTRAGGYTRVVKLGQRYGDGAEMAVLELVDYNLAQETTKRKQRVSRSKTAQTKKAVKSDQEPEESETVEQKKTRRGRKKKTKTADAAENIAGDTVEITEEETAPDSNVEPEDAQVKPEDNAAAEDAAGKTGKT